MNRYTIKDMRADLERKMNRTITDDEFVVMTTAFVTYIVKRGLYTKQAVYKALKRGWMSVKMAHFFKSYALQ